MRGTPSAIHSLPTSLPLWPLVFHVVRAPSALISCRCHFIGPGDFYSPFCCSLKSQPSLSHKLQFNKENCLVVSVRPVFEEYQKISGRDIEDSIKREMSGCLEDVFLAIGLCLPRHAPLWIDVCCRSRKTPRNKREMDHSGCLELKPQQLLSIKVKKQKHLFSQWTTTTL